MSNMTKITFAAILVIAIAFAFGGGYYFGQVHEPTTTTGISVIDEAWHYLTSNYVDPSKLNSENMTSAAIKGMISTLDDPYTTYLSTSEYKALIENLQGESYAGIGAVVSIRDEKLVIVYVFADSPAEKAGLKSGDTVLEANGESLAGLTLDVAVSKIRGPENTPVQLLVLHENETEAVSIQVIRAIIDVPSVYLEMRGEIACIFLIQFNEHTEEQLIPIIKQLKEANTKGIVLDLRDNPGGVLDVVVQVASTFITEGIIVKVQSNEGVIDIHEAVAIEETTDLPMVVLVNENSASGAEVLSGALQDHNRAVIAGNTTYGKGSVTLPIKLSDGSGLFLTIARWLTPNDRLIEGQGIIPDIKLELTYEEELQWAIDYLLDSISS